MKRKYSWIPDIPDFRDFKLDNKMLKLVRKLPDSVDLRPYCSKIEDQETLGSCTGNAIVGALEYLENKVEKDISGNVIDLSRLFVYYNERWIENTIFEDSGAMIRDGIKSLAKWGVCTESLWPYNIDKFTEKPTNDCYTDAFSRRISLYARVRQDIKSIKRTLASGFPIIFGFSVYDSFESEEVSENGIMNMPTEDDTTLGGHAVLCVGYDDSIKRVIVRNSWGESWGQKGYFTMPYEYISNKYLASDLWVITSFKKS